MKNGWPTKMLAEVCDVFADGDWVESKDQSPGGIRLIQTGNVGEGAFKHRGEKARYISEATFKRLRCSEVFEGDCLISRLPDPVGRSCLLPDTGERMITAVDCTIVRFNANQLLPRFFTLYSESLDYLASVDAETTGTTRKRISRSKLGQIGIPVPPIPEQHRIVGILDDAFEGITTATANAEKNLANARALFESHLQSIVTQPGAAWVERKLGDVCTIARGGSPRPIQRFLTDAPDGINWIKIGDATASGKYIYKTEEKIIAEGARRSRIVHDGDFLLSNSMSFGRPYIMRTTGCIHDGWLVLTDYASHLDQDYLYYVLGSQLVFLQFDRLAAGSTVRNLNIELASRADIPIPPLTQQREIARQLDKISVETQRLESLYERRRAALESLKKSLLHQAFSGQLTAGQSVQVQVTRVTYPATLPGMTTTDLHAGILAMAFEQHEKTGKVKVFTHVKAEKIAHMVEARLGIDLGRSPVKDAAGPNDFPHLKKVEHRARMANYFDFRRVDGAEYRAQKLRGFKRLIDKTHTVLGHRLEEVQRLLEWMLPLKVRQAEIVATVFAAWNNLLLEGKRPTDEQIVFEARENWHPEKLGIDRQRFFAAVQWLREQGVIPEGKGKRVGEKGK